MSYNDFTERKSSEPGLDPAREIAQKLRDDVEEINRNLELAVLKANELALAAEAEKYAKNVLVSAIPSILIGVCANTTITEWNTVAEATFGLPASSMVGKPFEACPIPWKWDRILQGIVTCQQEQRPVRVDDLSFSRRDGKEGFLGLTITPMQSAQTTEFSFLIFGADITERKMLETQLTHAQKMESIGQLAAGIAHEINTPTQYVGDNTRFLQDSFEDLRTVIQEYERLLEAVQSGTVTLELAASVVKTVASKDVSYLMEEIPQAIRQSLDGIGRVAQIVQAMKEFSHPGTSEKTAIDINRAIESTATVARNEWKYVADLALEFDPELPPVPCLPGDFNQVILNILVNAAHAIRDALPIGGKQKGTITISTRREGDWAEIRIQDTGTGIPEAARARVFDPFYTTKEVGRGTGQGLAIAHSIIVEKHGGTIRFETEQGKGTTFILCIPLHAENASMAMAA